MWLITPFGFFSVVRKQQDRASGTLTIRARVRTDLEAIEERYRVGLGPISESAATDYRFRATVRATDFAAAMVKIVADIDYGNFKDRVKQTQGSGRAHIYGDVWSALYKLQSAKSDPVAAIPPRSRAAKANAAGGVLVDSHGRLLLREPTGHFDRYVWTFPKGKVGADGNLEETALREVFEETGYHAEIVGSLPRLYEGGTSRTKMFLMRPVGDPDNFDPAETEAIRWADPKEARGLVGLTTNDKGRKRDLDIIEDAAALIDEMR